MPVSVAASGTQTATLATDHTLTTTNPPSGGAVYQLRVDSNAMAAGETLTLTLQTRALNTGTTRTLYQAVYANAQGEPIKDSPAVGVQYDATTNSEIKAILRQDGGTGRAYPWALLRLDG